MKIVKYILEFRIFVDSPRRGRVLKLFRVRQEKVSLSAKNGEMNSWHLPQDSIRYVSAVLLIHFSLNFHQVLCAAYDNKQHIIRLLFKIKHSVDARLLGCWMVDGRAKPD